MQIINKLIHTMKKMISSKSFLKRILMLVGLLASLSLNAADNLRLHGTLIHEACDVSPGDEFQTLELGVRSDRYLYLNTRTPSRTIRLTLINCDTSIGNMVTLSFSGNENSELSGYLELDGNSLASGIGVGIETPEGKLIPVNDTSGVTYPIINGNNVITFKGFIQGEPTALANHTIKPGPYSALTTFNLEYN